MNPDSDSESRAFDNAPEGPIQRVSRLMLATNPAVDDATILTRLRRLALRFLGKVSQRLSGRRKLSSIPRVLAIVRSGDCRKALEDIFEHSGWGLKIADAPPGSSEYASSVPFVVILYERDLAGGNWGSQVEQLSSLSPRPWIILLSDTADKNLWDELGRHGGSDIVRLPVEREPVIQAVQRGLILWRNQQRTRLQPKDRFWAGI